MDDKRLDRLFDYTKFHIGIYISASGGLVTLIGLSAKAEEGRFIANLVGSPIALLISLGLMVLAGAAGGVIATSCTESRTFDDFWDNPQGAFGWKPLNGKRWPRIEHLLFWLSAICFAYAILSAPPVTKWILHTPTPPTVTDSVVRHSLEPCIEELEHSASKQPR